MGISPRWVTLLYACNDPFFHLLTGFDVDGTNLFSSALHALHSFEGDFSDFYWVFLTLAALALLALTLGVRASLALALLALALGL